MFYKEPAGREEVCRGFVEHKAQRPHIDASPRAFAGVEKLHIAVLKESEFQSLRGIVDLCRDHWERHF